MARAFVGLFLGGIIALVTASVYARGVVGSKSGEPYRRDQDSNSFWAMIIGLACIAAFFLLRGAIDLLTVLDISN